MKKIMLGLFFLIVFGFYYTTYACDISENCLGTAIGPAFTTKVPVILITLVIFNSIVFCILAKKYNKITLKYLIVLIIILLSYIISYRYMVNRYDVVIVPFVQHMSIVMISVGVMLGIFIKKNKFSIIISSLPAVFYIIFGQLVNMFDIIYLLNIEILTQIILCPIYLSYKNK